jgi:pimeloyl-ACP methyl ester carboxylesterase
VRAVDVGGLRLAVSEAGAGVPVVLHPGLGYASWAWHRLVPLLASGRRVIVFDPRGTGRSDKPQGPYTIELLAEDVAALLRVLEAAPAHVVGHSMGGYVAQLLGLRHPDLVRSLVLMATSPGGADAAPVPAATRRAWEEAAGLEPATFAAATFAYAFREGWAERHPERFREDLARRLHHPTPPERWRDQYLACEGFLEAGAPVERIAAPVLVLHGSADRVVPAENARLFARRIPGARVQLLDGVGHNLMLEEPRVVAEVLDAFFSEVEGTGPPGQVPSEGPRGVPTGGGAPPGGVA